MSVSLVFNDFPPGINEFDHQKELLHCFYRS